MQADEARVLPVTQADCDAGVQAMNEAARNVGDDLADFDWQALFRAFARHAQQAREAEREACAEACRAAVPKAHTYASENADLYHAGDAARDRCIAAIRSRKAAL